MSRSLLTPLLASIILASTTDALSWNIVPTDPTHVLLGDNVSLAWDYELDPGEDTNGFFQVIWARHEPHGWVNLAVKSSLLGISILRDEGHVLVDADAEATFIIMNVRESDHARYRCSIESKMSLSPASVQLNVLVPATVVWISENESFIEGASVTLSCWVKGNPVPYVTWYSPNGTLVHNATNSNNNSYTITGLRLDHVGAYRCFTKNVHGTDDKITYIYLPPSITTITPTLQTVNESDTTSIYCNASGLPAPSISWSKMSSGVTIATGEHLVINNINRSESGDYLCTASNGVLGSALANATINVQLTLVESKEDAEDQNESYKTQHENATGQAWTTEKRLENSPQNEDEGIEMDMYSDRDSRVSRLSTRTEHAPNSRPHTPLHKNRVHPAQGPAHREGACTTNSDQFIPTEYAAVLEKSGTKDRLYAELAWLETKGEPGRPKRRQRLPSISGSAVPQRKYSILEILKDQQRPRANTIGSEARPRTSSVGNESTVEYTNESI